MALKEPRYDVTSDVLKAIVEHIGVGMEANVHVDGKPAYVIIVKAAALALATEPQP